MGGKRISREKSIEKAVRDILKSKAKSCIYLYLLKKNGVKTGQIIKGTKLHPSTVRETLSRMYDLKIIYRKKIKNNSIGKNPYIYFSIPPIELLKKYAGEIEDRLNKLASLTNLDKIKNYKPVIIKIQESSDQLWT